MRKVKLSKEDLLLKQADEKYLNLLDNEEQTDTYFAKLHEAQEKYALALSLEPTVEEISYLISEVKKGTELEVVLMNLKVFTLEYL